MVMHANEFKTKEKQKLINWNKKIHCTIYNKLVSHINTVCMTSHVVIKVGKVKFIVHDIVYERVQLLTHII